MGSSRPQQELGCLSSPRVWLPWWGSIRRAGREWAVREGQGIKRPDPLLSGQGKVALDRSASTLTPLGLPWGCNHTTSTPIDVSVPDMA